jgi:hypothetical protein
MPPETTEVMWLAKDSAAYTEGFVEGCAPKPAEGVLLPKGLRGVARAARAECGKD